MSGLFLKGEKKERAGVYRRHEQITNNGVASAMNGVFCIPVHADFGPVGEIQKITSKSDLLSLYMESGTIDAAVKLFDAGANRYIFTVLELVVKKEACPYRQPQPQMQLH